MSSSVPVANPLSEVRTSSGAASLGFRVISINTGVKFRTLAEADKWLLKNAAKVDTHAKASTKRLIGRESV